METALQTLNELVRDRLVAQYANGGAMALLFYTEPALTYDQDVFCLLPEQKSGLVTIETKWCRSRGFRE